MADDKDNRDNATTSVGDQAMLEMMAENQNMIRGLLSSLPSTIASATAAALRQPPCVPKQQLGGVLFNNR